MTCFFVCFLIFGGCLAGQKNFDSKKVWAKPIAFGALASIFLAVVYLTVLSLLNSFSHALWIFSDLWLFMVPIIFGFGLQIALFVYVRNAHSVGLCSAESASASAKASVASGTVSTASMVACCAHHITDVLPILGVSAALVFLDKFQAFFLLFGLFSNIGGSLMMLNQIKKHSLYSKQQVFFGKIMLLNLEFAFKAFIVAGTIILIAFFLLLASK